MINLPQSLTHLTFGRNFNQPINNLPKSLTNLIVGFNFNQAVNHLPKSIIVELKFSESLISIIEKKVYNIFRNIKSLFVTLK